MSNRSPRRVPGRTVRELGLPARAVTALDRAGISDVADLAALTRAELAGIAGLGPGSIAAIRAVVPEPGTATPGPGAGTAGPVVPAPGTAGAVTPEPADEESPDAPAIPSFASLRDPRRRTALDLLVPAATQPAEPPAPGPREAPVADHLAPGPVSEVLVPEGSPAPAPSRAAGPAAAGQAPPAEYADLLRWGVHLAAAAAGVPLRVVRWSVREPLRGLRRLLGD